MPDLYSAQLDLPPAEERFGKTGLHTLAERWTARSTYPFNRLASLNKTMDLFFEQLKSENRPGTGDGGPETLSEQPVKRPTKT